jgi:hypothetical protein
MVGEAAPPPRRLARQERSLTARPHAATVLSLFPRFTRFPLRRLWRRERKTLGKRMDACAYWRSLSSVKLLHQARQARRGRRSGVLACRSRVVGLRFGLRLLSLDLRRDMLRTWPNRSPSSSR